MIKWRQVGGRPMPKYIYVRPSPLHRSDETTPPAEQRCGDCALWGTDKQDEEQVDGVKHCPRWHCWTGKGLGPIHDCFVQKEEE